MRRRQGVEVTSFPSPLRTRVSAAGSVRSPAPHPRAMSGPMHPRPYTLSPDRAAVLRPLLDALDMALDRTSRIAADPVELPRRYADPDDAEVAALFAASLAYGRADVFKPVVERVLAAMGAVSRAFVGAFARAPEPRRLRRRPSTGSTGPPDVAALAAAIGHVRARHGSLGARFAALLREAGGGAGRAPHRARPLRRGAPRRAARRGAARAAAAARALAPPARRRRARAPRSAGTCTCAGWCAAPTASTSGSGAACRPSALVVPLDTHVHRVARALGLTVRPDASWRTAEEITAALRRARSRGPGPVRLRALPPRDERRVPGPARRAPLRARAPSATRAAPRAGRAPRRRARAARRRSGSARARTS